MTDTSTDLDPALAQRMYRALEPYHSMAYFAPEAYQKFEEMGFPAMSGYFSARAAAMGAVTPEVVIATFYNFAPEPIRDAFAKGWVASPDAMVEARLSTTSEALRRVLGDELDSPEVAEAAGLAREAGSGCPLSGRPLFAGQTSLPWPDEPHLVLWHAISLLREFRGDGHIAVLVTEELDGCDALVLHAATGRIPKGLLKSTRSWSEQEWDAAEERLRGRGWVEEDGSLSDSGRTARRAIEDKTDRLALAPWRHLGEERSLRLESLVAPLSTKIVEGGGFPAAP